MSLLIHGTRSLYYDGKDQLAKSGKTFSTTDPSTGKHLADVQKASHADIDAAIASATKAFPVWSKTTPIERSRVLLKAVSLLRERNDLIAQAETHDTGKAYSETSTVDVVTGADSLEYYANLVASGGLNGESYKLREDAIVYTTKEPLGVCAGIGAWNYPIQMTDSWESRALWKSAPCLAAGNTMVYKPSEFTPLHAEVLARIYTEAGVPPGVFNVVQGDGSVGSYLTAHPQIAKVSFTGQVSTGQKVAASAGGNMKYVTMELGGKSPLVILPDANVEKAVDGAMMANFFSTGQVCTNGTRVFVPRSMQSQFERTLKEKMRYIRPGELMDSATNYGPLVSKVHYEKVVKYIRHGKEVDGAKVLYGGNVDLRSLPGNPDRYAGGFWIEPTVFTDCTDDMLITGEEIFGPVMTILPYDTEEEVVRRANNTNLGLAAGVFTDDVTKAHRVISRLEAGICWVNTWGESPSEMAVGGWKMSGLGVENGRRGLEAWVRNKSTLVELSGEMATVFTKR